MTYSAHETITWLARDLINVCRSLTISQECCDFTRFEVEKNGIKKSFHSQKNDFAKHDFKINRILFNEARSQMHIVSRWMVPDLSFGQWTRDGSRTLTHRVRWPSRVNWSNGKSISEVRFGVTICEYWAKQKIFLSQNYDVSQTMNEESAGKAKC